MTITEQGIIIPAYPTGLSQRPERIYLFTQILAVAGLFLVLKLALLPAVLAGFLTYLIVEFGARMLVRVGIKSAMAKLILFVFLTLAVFSVIVLCVALFASQVTHGPESIVALLQRMADVVDRAQLYLPGWMQQHMPANIEEWKVTASDWLRENASHIGEVGRDVGAFLFHVIIGMLIGGMVALNPAFQTRRGPLADGINERVGLLANAFQRIVFSQVRISALNTFFTAIFLVIVLPAFGSPLPLTKTMIVVTFLAGMLPIVGNLISNTVITLIALSVSPPAAAGSLAFLILIHKLEYFINARIIGTQIRARAWEILLAMVAMEAAFGVAGLVAAPIYYAYIKDELTAQKLI